VTGTPKTFQKAIETLNHYRMSYFNSFREQRIKGWYFVPSFFCTFTLSVILSIFLIIAGSIHLATIAKLSEVTHKHIIWVISFNELKVEYGNVCQNMTMCILEIELEENFDGPVFLYYGMKYFYQNHREFIISFNFFVKCLKKLCKIHQL